MDRRTFLNTVGAGIAVTVAGCTESGTDGTGGGGGSGGAQNGTDPTRPTTGANDTESTTSSTESTRRTPNESTETPAGETTTDGESLAIAETSFEVTSNDCGGGVDEATATVDGDGVTVDGTITGRNGCETARIADTTVTDGTLTVAVESYVPESEKGNACVECLVDIVYTASVTMASGTPASVVVEHHGEPVTETTTQN